MTLAEFLLARIAEDETCPVCSHPRERHLGRWCRVERAAVNAAGQTLICCCAAVDREERVLAECAAKRAILAEHVDINGGYCQTCSDGYHGFDCEGGWEEPFPCTTLRALASVYADHDDYRAEWKP